MQHTISDARSESLRPAPKWTGHLEQSQIAAAPQRGVVPMSPRATGPQAPAQGRCNAGLRAPRMWQRLPAEVRFLVFDHCTIPGYVDLALVDSQTYALAQTMPGWRWVQQALCDALASAATDEAFVATLYSHQRTVRAGTKPLSLPQDPSQKLMLDVHAALADIGGGRGAQATFFDLDAVLQISRVPKDMDVIIDLSTQQELHGHVADGALRIVGVTQLALDDLQLEYALGPGLHEIVPTSLTTLSLDDNDLHEAVIALPTTLAYLSLAGNQLTGPALGAWHLSPNLVMLNVSGNRLTSADIDALHLQLPQTHIVF